MSSCILFMAYENYFVIYGNFFFYFIFKLYNIVLVLPNIKLIHSKAKSQYFSQDCAWLVQRTSRTV